MDASMSIFGGLMILYVLWMAVTVIQGLLAYGTAYRLTRDRGDNGISLFLWMFLMNLAAAVPGLGIFLWFKYRDK